MYGGMINDGCVCGHASATMLAGVYADLDLPEGCQAGFGFKKCAWIATWLSGAVPAILRPCTTAPSPHNQVWFGAIIGVVPFVIGTYEFTKRIVSGCGGPRPTEGHGASQQRGSARLSALLDLEHWGGIAEAAAGVLPYPSKATFCRIPAFFCHRSSYPAPAR